MDVMPRPNVSYRIQNVDFRNFLERRFETTLVVRAMKDSLEQQVRRALTPLKIQD
jgi:hypothetical protein